MEWDGTGHSKDVGKRKVEPCGGDAARVQGAAATEGLVISAEGREAVVLK